MKKEDQAQKQTYRKNVRVETKIPNGYTLVTEYGQGEQFDTERFDREAITLYSVGSKYGPIPGYLCRTADGRMLLLTRLTEMARPTAATKVFRLTFAAASEWIAAALKGGHYTPEQWLRLHGLKPESEQGGGSVEQPTAATEQGGKAAISVRSQVFNQISEMEGAIYQAHGLLDLLTMRFVDYVNDHGATPEMDKALAGFLHLENSVRAQLSQRFEALCNAISQ